MARVLSAADRAKLAFKASELGRALAESEIEDVLAGRPCGGCKEKREEIMSRLKNKRVKEVQS